MTVRIETIPAHVVYQAEYEVNSVADFFNEETGENILMDLDIKMHSENPGVHVPEEPDDYNYMVHPVSEIERSLTHVRYCDMVNKAGTDSPEGAYVFREMPEVTCAIYTYKGAFECLGTAITKALDYVKENGLELSGEDIRSSYIHGPWDTEDKSDYEVEIQVPVKK